MPRKILKFTSKANFEVNDLCLATFQNVMDIYHDSMLEEEDRNDAIIDALYTFDKVAEMMCLYEEEGE